MSEINHMDADQDVFRLESFEIRDLQDEIRADQLCRRLLEVFYLDLVEQEKLAPEEASAIAYGADYFLREFLIPDRQENIFELRPGRVRQFGGNWYIVRNLEPNMTELGNILKGVEAFYDYCRRVGKVSTEQLMAVRRECSDLEFYSRRIESFWAIEKDGFFAWDAECNLRD